MRGLFVPARLVSQSFGGISRVAYTRGHATAVEEYRRDSPEVGAGATELEAHDSLKKYSKQEISEIYNSPLLPLVFRAAGVHAANHDPTKIQLATLMNIKSTWYRNLYGVPGYLELTKHLLELSFIQVVDVLRIVRSPCRTCSLNI